LADQIFIIFGVLSMLHLPKHNSTPEVDGVDLARG
jgi:hypothetical protein